jgi:hypothetical protein
MKSREVSEQLIKAAKALLDAIPAEGDDEGKKIKKKKSVLLARSLLGRLPRPVGGGPRGGGPSGIGDI